MIFYIFSFNIRDYSVFSNVENNTIKNIQPKILKPCYKIKLFTDKEKENKYPLHSKHENFCKIYLANNFGETTQLLGPNKITGYHKKINSKSPSKFPEKLAKKSKEQLNSQIKTDFMIYKSVASDEKPLIKFLSNSPIPIYIKL